MAVDEAGHHVIIGQVDDGGPVRRDETGLDRLNPLAADQDGLLGQGRLARDGQQPSGVDDGQGVPGTRLGLRDTGGGDKRQRGQG